MSTEKNTITKSHEVLAFVTDSETRDILKKIPAGDFGLKITVQEGDVRSAYTYFQENRTPEIIIVDVSNSDLPISDVGRLAEVCEPGVEVIVVGVTNDVSVFRGLLQLGVKDYLTKPLNEALFVKAFKNLRSDGVTGTEWGTGFSRYGNQVTFIGGHGGVGVTTLAANTAYMMAQDYHRRIALLDLDLQRGMISHLFNQSPSVGLADIFSSPDRVDQGLLDRLLVHVNDHLSIACGQETVMDQEKFSVDALQKMINVVNENYHYAFIDCPSHIRADTMGFLLNSSQIIVLVIDFTIFSIRNATLILQQLNQSIARGQRVHVIANRVGEYRKGELDQEMVEKTINHPIDLLIRFDAVSPLEFANLGRPFVTEKSSFTDDIRSLCNLLTGSAAKKPASKGLLAKLGLK